MTWGGPSLCLVFGDGPSLSDDYNRFLNVLPKDMPYDICAINRAVFKATGVSGLKPKYCYSYHEDFFKEANVMRTVEWLSCYEESYTFCKEKLKEVDNINFYHIPDTNGSSALNAVYVLINHFKYDKVVVCGVPLDKKGYEENFGPAWFSLDPYYKAKTRAMSGVTFRALSGPSTEWLLEKKYVCAS